MSRTRCPASRSGCSTTSSSRCTIPRDRTSRSAVFPLGEDHPVLCEKLDRGCLEVRALSVEAGVPWTRCLPPLAFFILLFSGWVYCQRQAVIDYRLKENRVLR